jgi:choline dehydrogenase-like flavoprotein
MSEQTPNPASRVSLTDKRDAFGLPRVALEWRLSEQDLQTIRAGQRAIDTALQSSGRGRLYAMFDEDSPPISGGWHHMGTTRMSDAESRGVVDSDARVHSTTNVFVAGSSVFPTVGYANPTLTLVALAIKLAGHLISLESAPRVATGAGIKDSGASTRDERRREVAG